MEHRGITVIGGGLAGMTVAYELAQRGQRVRIIESSPRLGGKATAHRAVATGQMEDHGYHIFPGWYLNTRRLLRELGCDSHLIDFDRYHWLRPGEFPRFMTMYAFTSARNLWRDLHCGILPWPEMLMSGYFLLDLLCEPFSNRAFLDRVSVGGFLRSRFYASDAIGRMHHQFTLQAGSVPYYELSAMTLQKIFKGWGAMPSPQLSVLNGDLRTRFIEPFERRLVELGVEILTEKEVVRLEIQAGRIARVWLRNGAPLENATEEDLYALCVPHDEAHELVDDDLYDAENRNGRLDAESRGLADLVQLRSAPMAAWHVYFKRRIPGIPREHVNFVESRYGLSFIDVSQIFDGLDTTVLNCIAAYYEPLSRLTQDEAERHLRQELLRYLPHVSEDDFETTFIQPHNNEKLFLNTMGAWHFRPNPQTGIDNLFIAGDYCRSNADLTTMESAVGSALRAAEVMLKKIGGQPRVRELPLPEPPRWQLLAVKYLSLPLIVPLALWLRLRERQRSEARP